MRVTLDIIDAMRALHADCQRERALYADHAALRLQCAPEARAMIIFFEVRVASRLPARTGILRSTDFFQTS